MVKGARCFGMTTVRTPGAWSAIETGSAGWVDADFLEPHAPSPIASAATSSALRSPLPDKDPPSPRVAIRMDSFPAPAARKP